MTCPPRGRHRDTKPGIPGEAAAFGNAIDQANPNPALPRINPGGGPLPPGQFYKNIAKLPGSTPVAAVGAVNGIYAAYTGIPDVVVDPAKLPLDLDRIPPGMATKSFTRGCASGHTAIDEAVNGGGVVCH